VALLKQKLSESSADGKQKSEAGDKANITWRDLADKIWLPLTLTFVAWFLLDILPKIIVSVK
jgi:hypothetical protein